VGGGIAGAAGAVAILQTVDARPARWVADPAAAVRVRRATRCGGSRSSLIVTADSDNEQQGDRQASDRHRLSSCT
jgi:hypothetical protein